MADTRSTQNSESKILFQWAVFVASIFLYILFLYNRWTELFILIVSLGCIAYVRKQGGEQTSSQFFTKVLKEVHITECVCPICHCPVLPEEDLEYFSHLGINLNDILDLVHLQKFNKLFEELLVPANMHIKNGNKGQFNDQKNYLVNGAEQKQEDSSRTLPLQQKQSPEKLLEETESNGIEYTPVYLDVCKHFEDEDHATCQKKVDLTCKLIDYEFCTDRAIDAAKNCDDFRTAAAYLSQKCDSCNKEFSLPEIVPMLMCTHKFCKSCTKIHFAEVITEKNILKCTCKICEMPILECEEKAIDYFSSLDKDLKIVLPNDIYQIFKQKLESGGWKTELNSKKRPEVMNNKNSQTVDQLAITSKHHIIESSRATNTGHVNESAKNLQTSCSMCNRNIRISKPSDLPTMPGCFHKFCKPCFELYFTDIINHMDVTMWLCPLCGDSSITDYQTYFKEFAEVLNEVLMDKLIVEIANERLDRWFRSQESTNTGFELSVILYECKMCVKKVRESELIGMPRCQHRFCIICTIKYFSMVIKECALAECYCPFCLKEEDMSLKEKLEYFTQLGQILKPLIYSNTFRKFERILDELSYTDMCIKCYSPVKPRTMSRTVECEYCSTQACRECRLLWDPAHYGKSCKDYEVWISTLPCHAYNMSRQPIVCGSCGETFLLIRDGTLLFSCPKCQKQMCRSCKSFFYLGAECPEGEDKCSLLFFHAHHPVNCLFYLQNNEVDVLYQFLKDRNLEPRRTTGESFSCKVEVKKIFGNQIIYDKCGQVLWNNYLGLCKNHAVDFLSTITVKYSVDTRVLFDEDDLRIYNQRNVK